MIVKKDNLILFIKSGISGSKTKPTTLCKAEINIAYSPRFTELLMSKTQHYVWHEARFSLQSWMQFLSPLKVKTGYCSSDSTL